MATVSCFCGISQSYGKDSSYREVKFVRLNKEDHGSIEAQVWAFKSTGARYLINSLSGDRVTVIKQSGYDGFRDLMEGGSSQSELLSALSCKAQEALLSISGLNITATTKPSGEVSWLEVSRKG